MEELARIIIDNINKICIDFYYFRKENIMKVGMDILPNIQKIFEQINLFANENPQDKDIVGMQNFALNVIKDLLSAIENEDKVLLVDTLDFGVRELMNIFIEEGSDDYE